MKATWRGKREELAGTPVKMSQLGHFNVSEKLSANQKELTRPSFPAGTTHIQTYIINGILKLSHKSRKCLENV
jgi:hypothetical protein